MEYCRAKTWSVPYLLVALTGLAAQTLLAADALKVDKAIAQLLVNAPAEAVVSAYGAAGIQARERELYAVYHERGLSAIWVTDDGPQSHATALLEAIGNAQADGLDPERYGLSLMRASWDERRPDSLARLDVLISTALVTWVNDLRHGRVHPQPDHPDRFVQGGALQPDAGAVIDEFSNAKDPTTWLQQLFPGHHYYRGLKDALQHYRELAAEGGWDQVSSGGSTLHPGDKDPRVQQIRTRLRFTDTAPETAANPDVYDQALAAAVKRFQLKHGLDADGITGGQTIAEMNRSLEYRIRQIEMNLERWRWTAHELGSAYVLVDIAGFDVQGVSNDKAHIEMRGIVGKLHHETPIFSDHIKYIEFNPYWNLTPSITRHETVPKIRKDPDYLANKHIRVFDGWGPDAKELDPQKVDWKALKNPGRFKFRQDPGPWNALGTMKFIFPNKYSVYLHDTPNHQLFEKSSRGFSHGCIRLDQPAQLAQWILGMDDPSWDAAKIQAVVDSHERTVKVLKTPLAVHITYETAWVDIDSRLRFAPDIYGRDKLLEKALY